MAGGHTFLREALCAEAVREPSEVVRCVDLRMTFDFDLSKSRSGRPMGLQAADMTALLAWRVQGKGLSAT